jgi:hypothetical protein
VIKHNNNHACIQFSIFNFFLITTAPILFKFGVKHLWGKGGGGVNGKFKDSCPPPMDGTITAKI